MRQKTIKELTPEQEQLVQERIAKAVKAADSALAEKDFDAISKVFHLQFERPFTQADLPLLTEALSGIKRSIVNTTKNYEQSINAYNKIGMAIEAIIKDLMKEDGNE